MMSHNKFATSISCIDGRIQLPVIHWLQDKYDVKFIDTITEPGVDKLFLSPTKIQEIKSKAVISIKAHGSNLIAISGHHNCAGNPTSKSEHYKQIKKAVEIIQAWKLPVKVIGLWVNEDWQVEVIDSK